MKKLVATALAALVVIAVTYEQPKEAQSGAPDGDSFRAKADDIREAVLNGTPSEMFNLLAPWLQGRAKLFKARWPLMIDEFLDAYPDADRAAVEKEMKADILRRMKERDPGNTLRLETFDDFMTLDAAEMVALEMKQLSVQNFDRAVEGRKAEWFEVERVVYQAAEFHDWANDEQEFERTHGEIVFMNKFNDIVIVRAVADGNTWHIVSVGGEIGKHSFGTEASEMLEDPIGKFIEQEVRDAKRAEAEQMFGSMKNQARVWFSKTGDIPKSLIDDCVVNEAELSGNYFTLRDRIYSSVDEDRGAIVADPREGVIGYGVIFFDFEGGESEIKWFNNKKQLDKALKDFQEEE